MISIHDLSVSYAKARVLKGIDLEVKAGEIFGLIGLNGAGKTTLIKTILGLRPPNEGQISYDSGDRKEIAYLPERFEPPAFLSGEEFIRFSASLYKKKLDSAAMVSAAEALELDPAALKRRVHTLSKGMRQKLGLIATDLTGCHFLILDEPMSGLDPRARVSVKNSIARLRKAGRTVFLSSHILADLKEICDRVAVLDQGVIKFDGPPQDLCKSCATDSLERAFLQIIEKKGDKSDNI
jgi:ABC-2 type transport system ATP-binding protein